MNEQPILNEEDGGTAAPANVTGGVAGKETTGIPAQRRKELDEAAQRAKDQARRMVSAKDAK